MSTNSHGLASEIRLPVEISARWLPDSEFARNPREKKRRLYDSSDVQASFPKIPVMRETNTQCNSVCFYATVMTLAATETLSRASHIRMM